MAILSRHKGGYWLRLIATWWAAIFLFGIIRHYAWAVQPDFNPEELIEPWLDFSLGVVVGSGYFLIELIMNSEVFRRLRFLPWLALKSLLNLILIVVFIAVAVYLYPRFNEEVRETVTFTQVLFSKLTILILVYFTVVSLVITLLERMAQKVGPGIVGNMLLGKYHRPREEERVFLFIDLRDSTPIAEQLGHLKFSQLIQDCFADVTDAVLRHQAEIYQYVGDEVILCWKPRDGLRNNNCVAAYFSFTRTLAKRSRHYHATYGLQPVFKAAAHLGRTTVAEVGLVKRELAYHGDVLNTTARIQGKCNELGERLLLSGALAARLDLAADYALHPYEPVELTGKRERLSLVGVRPHSRRE